jgi:hypothetical protein
MLPLLRRPLQIVRHVDCMHLSVGTFVYMQAGGHVIGMQRWRAVFRKGKKIKNKPAARRAQGQPDTKSGGPARPLYFHIRSQ